MNAKQAREIAKKSIQNNVFTILDKVKQKSENGFLRIKNTRG